MDKKSFMKLLVIPSLLIFLWLALSLIRYRRKEKWAKKIVEGWRNKYHPFDNDSSKTL